MHRASETRIACLTPPGAGAIATLAVRGPEAWSITRSLFSGRLPEQPTAGRFYLGRIGDTNVRDEVVLTVKEDSLEIHCHGGVEVVRFIEEVFTSYGARVCPWTEFLRPDESPGVLDRLIHAPTVKTAAILLDQLHGALDRALGEITSALQAGNREAALKRLERLAQTQRLGRHLVEPFRVVIAGAPNVGKSSLVNAIAGYTRSLVSPIAGTTRDVVSTQIALDGWPVELVDTAGIHEPGSALELEGIARALRALGEADLRLWVVDASAPPSLPPPELRFDGIIINKSDLPSWGTVLSAACPTKTISCKTGEGIVALCEWIGTLLGLTLELTPGEGIAYTAALGDKVVEAYERARAEVPSASGVVALDRT